jgi:hypothetical protein
VGIPSLTVPYHDTNDFYFSGHIAWALIFANEILYCDSPFGKFFMVYQFFNSFYLMTVLHVHYAIDYYSAVGIAWLAVRTAEKMSWLPDTKIIGYPSQDRP